MYKEERENPKINNSSPVGTAYTQVCQMLNLAPSNELKWYPARAIVNPKPWYTIWKEYCIHLWNLNNICSCTSKIKNCIYTTSSPRHLLMIAPSPSDCSVLSVTVRTILDVIFYLYIQPSKKSQNAKKSHIVLENCRNWSRPVLFINQMCVLLMMSHFNNTTSTCMYKLVNRILGTTRFNTVHL